MRRVVVSLATIALLGVAALTPAAAQVVVVEPQANHPPFPAPRGPVTVIEEPDLVTEDASEAETTGTVDVAPQPACKEVRHEGVDQDGPYQGVETRCY